MSVEVKRTKAKIRAARRAEFRLRQRLEAIDWELDVLTPEIEEVDQAALKGLVPKADLVEGTVSQEETVDDGTPE